MMTQKWVTSHRKVKYYIISRILLLACLFTMNAVVIYGVEEEIYYLANFIIVFILSATSELIPKRRVPIRPSK